MESNHWKKIETIFGEAAQLPVGERRAFVKEKCGNDQELFHEISQLIEHDTLASSFLDEPLFSIGTKILALDSESILKTSEFGSYKLQRILGRGGMGLVLLAEDTKLNRFVALKVLSADLINHGETISRFIQEARTASKVSHPNVAHIYEFGQHQDRYFLAMEYIRGRSLRELIGEKSIDVPTALDIALQIASALQAAHEKGIIHRDIKPENIMVMEDGLIKVLDFGLAKVIESGEAKSISADALFETTPGLILGTVVYMSPEQVRAQNADKTSDFWSLGVVLYEMLAGKRPFDGETRSDSLAAILKSNPLSVRKLNPQVSGDAEKIILKLLHKSREERYQEADELIEDLHQAKQKAELRAKKVIHSSSFRKRPAEKVSFVNKYKVVLSAISVMLLLIAASLGVWFYVRSTDSATNLNKIRSLAVLPFVNDTGNGDKEFLSDGIAESLINRLSKFPNLTVKSRSAVLRYKGKAYDSKTIGKELAVQAILSGRIVERDGLLTISVELVDAQTGNYIWGENYSRKSDELLPLQTKLSMDVSQQIKDKITGSEQIIAEQNYTQNSQAFQLYLRGRFHWNKRTGTDLLKSIEFYNQALLIDPNFALAYVGLANSYVLLSGYGAASPQESFPKAEEAAKKALAIDDTLAEAHTSLSFALLNFDWNFEESEKAIKRAIAINPNYSTAYHWYGNGNLLAVGRMDESIAMMEKALSLDPLSLILNADLATSYLYAGKYDKAIEYYKKTLELDGNFFYARLYLGRAYIFSGDFESAISELKKARLLNDDKQILMLTAQAHIAVGDEKEARKVLAEMLKISETQFVSPCYFAGIYAGLGQVDEAFKWLEEGYKMREGPLIYLKVEPFYKNLHPDPRFASLVKRIGIP